MTQGLPVLRVATLSAEVGNWQRFLAKLGYRDWEGKPLADDESFGARTAFATGSYQLAKNLPKTEFVDVLTRKQAQEDGFVCFVQARNCWILHPLRSRLVTLVTIHTMEYPEKPTAAEDIALWFGGKTAYTPPLASAHYCLDEDSTVQCVREWDEAWHAGPVNGYSIGVEHAGYARQNPGQWADPASVLILERSARLVGGICRRYGIPVVKLSPAQLRAGERRGICGHVDVSKAFPSAHPQNDHTDPGPSFPYEHYLAMVKAYAAP